MSEIAVVVPFRGVWDAVFPTLQALSQQTIRSEITIVLSVDGVDKPPADIEDLVDVCVNGPHRGPASARNRGWKAVAVPFVLFTDSDCIPRKDWAQQMVDALKSGYHAVKGVYSAGGPRLIQRLAQVEFQERYRVMRRAETIYLADTYSAGFRREWLEKLDGFDERFHLPEHEDVDMSWRLIEAGGEIGFVAGAKVSHIHRESWIDYFRMKYRRGKWRTALVRTFPARAMNDGYTPQTLKLQVLFSFPVVLSLFLVPVFPMVTIYLWSAFLLLCMPILSTAAVFDPGTLIFVLFFALWRGIAICAGVLAGMTGGRNQCSLF